MQVNSNYFNIFCSYFMENHYAQMHVGVVCPNKLIIKEDENTYFQCEV